MKCKIFIAFLFCSITAFAQTNDKRITALEPQLNKLLDDWKAAGYAVAVVEKNKVIYAKGFGYRDVERKLPVTPNTLFAIGSCTKAFTSAVIGLLDKDKKVELDKPVRSYLPQLGFFNDAMTDRISLRDLMSHRTGLPRHDYSWYYFTTSSRDSLLQRIQYQEPSAGVRDKWQYNNFMFLLQGMVAEKISGTSWENFVKQNLFQPLNMNRSNFSVQQMAGDIDAAFGYRVKNDSIIKKMNYYNLDAMGPAGSINSSVSEMANWVSTWINNGKFNGKEILPEAYRQNAISSQMVISAALPDPEVPDVFFSNYGFGWILSSYRGHYRVDHGGNIDGFSANTAFFPSDSIGIVVLSNQNGSVIPSLVRNMIADQLLRLTPVDWNSRNKKQREKSKAAEAETKKTVVSSQKRGTTPSHGLTSYEGLYTHPGYGTMEIYARQDSLFVKTGKEVNWLKHYHYDIFAPYNVDVTDGIDTSVSGNLKFQFMMDLAGNINSVQASFEPTIKPLEFVRKPKEIKLAAASLEKYVGEYELAGMTAKIYIKGNALYLFVAGQPEYELAATGENKFILKALSGYSIEFHSGDKKDSINSASFIQPNGTFKATKK